MRVKFTKITVFTKEEDVDILTVKLSDLGADGFELCGGSELDALIDSTDPDLIDQSAFGRKSSHPDGLVEVTVYIPIVTDHSKIIEFLHSEGLEHTIGEVAESDWENNWKAYFKPLEVGNRLVIKPSWIAIEDVTGISITRDTCVEIDPASAFGTGQHATTRMCLELLEKYLTKADCVADIGCGSGILSAAAWLLGASSITAIDICANAIKVTEDTYKLNKVSNYKTYCGDIISDKKLCSQVTNEYIDLVVANITADIIIAMSDIFGQFGSVRTVILSGIIEHRLDEVLAAIKPTFTIVEQRESEGWVALVCSKKWYKRI